ncbi:MAG: hypothetical protein RL748_3738 [Pseudomonadota bacterium]|jgi:hypothetical protein
MKTSSLRPAVTAVAAVTLTALSLFASCAQAQACSKQSPGYSVALFELYTSEGCSSCPPADKYLSELRSKHFAPEQAVLLSMHVDYWNDIGWKDVYSKRVLTERQRWLSALAGSRTIYTPEVFMGGQELRGGVDGWRNAVPEAVKRINSRPAQADIHIALGKLNGNSLPLEVNVKAKQNGKLFVALVESGLVSEVKSGENSGAVLKHDYVVREWLAPVSLSGDASQTRAALTRAISLPAGANSKNMGIAAFVQNDKGEVLQALSLPLCNG